jgi:hypothetical protein
MKTVGKRHRFLPSDCDRPAYIEVFEENSSDLFSSEEIAEWARKLGRPGPNGERKLKELLILACTSARLFLSEGSIDHQAGDRKAVEDDQDGNDQKTVDRLPRLAERIHNISAELLDLPKDIQNALRVRIQFLTGRDLYKEMVWLRRLAQILEDVDKVRRSSGPKPETRKTDEYGMPITTDPPVWKFRTRVGQPSQEGQSFVVDVFYEVIEEFVGQPLPSPRSKKRHSGLELVRHLAQKMLPSGTSEAQIHTLLRHFHKRWVLRKRTATS